MYPGSFSPPTVAHLAVAEAAREHAGLARLDLVLSRRALGKEAAPGPGPEERVELLLEVAATRPWLHVRLTDDRLVADIAAGYDVVVMGADKWAQVRDPAWYGGSATARDAAVARLPRVLVAPRHGHGLTPADVAPAELLDVDARHHRVSSTAARAGREDWMLPEAVAWSRRRGTWASGAGPAGGDDR